MCLENRDSMGLLAAIFTGREVKARELLALPWTNINAQYTNGNTPLILAVQGKSSLSKRNITKLCIQLYRLEMAPLLNKYY